MKRKIFLMLILFAFSSTLCGCSDILDKLEQPLKGGAIASAVRIYDLPDGVVAYDECEVFIGGERIPVYSVMVNTAHKWTANNYMRKANGVCLFELDGIAEITVKANVPINYSSIMRPLSACITPIADIENNILSMTIKSAGEYVLEINADPYNAIHFFVSDYDEIGIDGYDGYRNIVIFDSGLHTAANDSRISASQNNKIDLSSDTLIYLADGAVVRGRFKADNANNIAIVGRGVIDGSVFDRDAARGTVTVPIELNYCSDVLLKDFTVLDPAGWCVSSYFTDGADIDNIKIITSRSNGDGISLQSSRNVTVDGCFVRTWDDSLVVKNYPRWDNRNIYGATDNIKFKNCTLWTDLAQSMELGYETVGVEFKNIEFDNITVLHAMDLAVMSIHNANNAEIRNVAFKNITVEDGVRAADNTGIIDFRVLYSPTWSDQHTSPTPLGNIDGVTVDNVNVLSAKKFKVTIDGCRDTRIGFESDHYVSNVVVKNIAVSGNGIGYEDCIIQPISQTYVRNFSVNTDDETEITGAKFIYSQSADKLLQYGKTCNVNIV